MKLAQCLLLSLWMTTSMCRASQWFVSTNGSGNGSFGSPWSLQTALTSSSIRPGDTVWLRNGVYFPVATNVASGGELCWSVGINGTNNNLITFRSYTNEWAAIDRMWTYNWQPFAGGYLRFRDLEFYNSLKGNEPVINGYTNGPWQHFAWNGGYVANSIEIINCVVHDVDNFCGSGINSIRGCIFWHVGLSTGLEHVCYPSPQTFSGNISGWHANDVIEHNIANFLMQSNIIFGTGNTSGGAGGGRDVLADGGSYQIINNYFYNQFSFLPWLGYGYPQTLSYLAGNISVVNSNIIVGPNPVTYNYNDTNFTSVSFLGNTVYANSTNFPGAGVHWFGSSGVLTFDYNHYFSTTTVTFENLGVYGFTFAMWRAANSSFDIHSTSSNSAVPPDSVNIIPNQDQPKRCHIAIYNWTHKDNVPVNLSGVLNAGDGYRLFSAQNYKAGAIQSGTFNGTNISVPMTNLTTAPILFGTNYVFNGVRLTQPPPTSPEFGAFVVIGSQHVLAPPEYVRVLSSGH
jgi:hypothetical protein